MTRVKPTIRSELPPNKEQQPGMVKRALRQRWGFYRPVSQASAQELSDALHITQSDINDYLKLVYGPDIPTLNINTEFGVTFVKQRRVGQQLFKALHAGFSMGRAIERLESQIPVSDNGLTVALDLDRLEWSDSKPSRKALVKLAISEGLAQLQSERQIINEVLSDLGIVGIVEDPNHITLFDYAPSRGRELKTEFKNQILAIVADYFQEKKIGEVVLRQLNIGPTYSTPCDLWENRVNGSPQPELIK